MAEKIIVATNTLEELKDMMGAVEKIAQHGQRVVFLIPYREDKVGWFQAHLAATQIDSSTMLTSQAIADHYSWLAQSRSAEQSIVPLREALKSKGVEVTVNLCTGKIYQALRNCISAGDIRLIVLPSVNRGRFAKLLHALRVWLFAQNHSSPVPVLAFRPIV
jgi:nucleotide-binding universal stress UspA family protein